MANEQNLKPLSTEKAREIGKKGGIASGKSKRARKTLAKELLILLSQGDTQEKISLAVIQKALNGDLKAFEVIRDTTGQKMPDKVEISQTIDESVREIDEYIRNNRK